METFKLFVFNGLKKRLFFRQTSEGGKKQRKFKDARKISPDLSTGIVDMFSLASRL